MRFFLNKNKILSFSLIVAILAELLLVYIIYFNPHKVAPIYDTSLQSWVSALFNGLSAISLIFAFKFAKTHQKQKHIMAIHFALLFSSLFLLNYIFYHLSVGHVKFPNNSFRPYYLIILFTHLLASITCLPMIFMTYALGFFDYLLDHKRFAKFTFFLWEYVSVTGVIVVLFLKFLK